MKNLFDLDIKILDKELYEQYKEKMFSYAHDGDAGFDLRSTIDTTVTPNERLLIGAGFAVDIKDHSIAMFILPRSGMAHKHGIDVSNAPGLIDSVYNGQIYVSVHNKSDADFEIKRGDRIAQATFMPVLHARPHFVEEFAQETSRGEGGFGSSGKL